MKPRAEDPATPITTERPAPAGLSRLTMAGRLRKFALTVHIVSSVGWVGAAIAYLAVNAATVASDDLQTVRAAYISMEWIALYAIVPLALTAFATGLINALGTQWGLFRRYWVIFKLGLTLFATFFLLDQSEAISARAESAVSGDPREIPLEFLHPGLGLIVLLIITALGVFKPPGLTRHGHRKADEQRRKARERRPADAL